jgi:hypothetical protein
LLEEIKSTTKTIMVDAILIQKKSTSNTHGITSCLLKNVRDRCRNKGQDFKIINRLCTGCKKLILPEADGGNSL